MSYFICVLPSLYQEKRPGCYCSVTQSCPTLCNPMACSTPGLPVLHHLPKFAQVMSIALMMPSGHLTPWCTLLLRSIFPNIRDFSNELAVGIRWSKYWSFSFSTSPSNKSSGLISLKIDWFDFLAVQETFRGLFQHYSWRHQFFSILPSLVFKQV